MRRSRILAIMFAVTLALVQPSMVGAQTPNDLEAAWEQLKKLAGTWHRKNLDRGTEGIVSYHVTGGDAVVFEEFMGDTPEGVRPMATAYHWDVDSVVATHYCSAGNQPRMRSASWDPETKMLRFGFWDVTGLQDPDEYHTTDIELYFEDDDNVELRFRGITAGVQGEWTVNRMRRLTSRPHESEGGGA